MARSVADCFLVYTTLARTPDVAPSVRGLTIGILTRPPRVVPGSAVPEQTGGQRKRLEEQARQFEELGAKTVDVELPEPEADVVAAVLAEAAVSHRDLYPARRDEYGKDTREKLELARSVPAIAAHEARLAVDAWREAGREQPAVDLVLCPVLGGDVPAADAYEQDVRDVLLAYTRPFNFLDWSAIAIGELQLAGRNEAAVLSAALAWEQAYGPPSADDGGGGDS
jgi:Asp-tRNA(Asn)/Glu-tRNA(Gln) amidotransferase A subunit family amidase